MTAGTPIGRDEASERLAPHFTRAMRAATSRYGMFTDPPVVGLAMAVVVVTAALLYNLDVIDRTVLPVVYVLIALPVLGAIGLNLVLKRSRDELVAWLGALPFAVDNMNGLLNGVAAHVVVRFAEAAPDRQPLSDMLDEVHPDCFALEPHAEEPEIELVIGVADSKMNPSAASYRRFVRVRRMIDECLVPLSRDHAIESIRIA